MPEREKFMSNSIDDTGSRKNVKKYVLATKERYLVRLKSRSSLEVVRYKLPIYPERLRVEFFSNMTVSVKKLKRASDFLTAVETFLREFEAQCMLKLVGNVREGEIYYSNFFEACVRGVHKVGKEWEKKT